MERDMPLHDKFERVQENLIGIWRFRSINKKRVWCATFHYNGYYYDVDGCQDVAETLTAVYRKLQRLRQKRKRSISKA